MHPPATRVVYRDQPYLLELNGDGSVEAAFGPFAPGTEPSLAECREDNQVKDAGLIETLTALLPLSPSLPDNDDTLTNG